MSTSLREQSDDELVAASLVTPDDFGAIFERHYAVVAAYCRRRTGSQSGAEIAAETFARAFEHRARYRAGGLGARPWLLGIATHLIGDHRRAQIRQLRAYANQSTAPSDESARSDDRMDMRAMGRTAAGVIRGLPRARRDVLLLHAWADLTPDEIAVALAMPPGTVRSHLHRARAQVRDALDMVGDGNG